MTSMINVHEKKFINDFIVSNKKGRLEYEFSTPKKRKEAIMRFCHDLENLIDHKYVKTNISKFDLVKYVPSSTEVYIISLSKLNGEYCSIKEGVEHLNKEYMPVIILYANVAIIKTEDESSKVNVYILEKF